jgi:hypothetical protein
MIDSGLNIRKQEIYYVLDENESRIQSDQACLFLRHILQSKAMVDHSVVYPAQNKYLCLARLYSPVLEH